MSLLNIRVSSWFAYLQDDSMGQKDNVGKLCHQSSEGEERGREVVERLRDIKHQNGSNCHKSMTFCVLIVFLLL